MLTCKNKRFKGVKTQIITIEAVYKIDLLSMFCRLSQK